MHRLSEWKNDVRARPNKFIGMRVPCRVHVRCRGNVRSMYAQYVQVGNGIRSMHSMSGDHGNRGKWRTKFGAVHLRAGVRLDRQRVRRVLGREVQEWVWSRRVHSLPGTYIFDGFGCHIQLDLRAVHKWIVCIRRIQRLHKVYGGTICFDGRFRRERLSCMQFGIRVRRIANDVH